MGFSISGITSFFTDRVEAAAHDVVDSVEDAGSTAFDALKDFGRGIGEMSGGFATNLLQGNLGEALESVERGADQAIFQTSERLATGTLSSAQKLTNSIFDLSAPLSNDFRTDSDRVFDIAQGAIDTSAGIASDCVRLGPDLANGVAGDLERSVKMAADGRWGDALGGLWTTAENAGLNAAGGVVDLTARGLRGSVSGVLTAVGDEPPARGLNASERAYLESIYGDSIDYDLIRIKKGGWATDDVLPATHTVGNTIYMKSTYFDANGNLTPEGLKTLGHEAGHVWQNQNGGGDYIHNALFANLWATETMGNRNEAYDWRRALSQGESFTTMNDEEQAEVMSAIGQALADDGMITAADGGKVPYSPAELAFLREVAEKIKNGEWAG
jgi:hypothetical protein